MHSSRMHTARSSGCPGGSPPGAPQDQTPWEQAPPGTRHPPGPDLHPRTRHPPGTGTRPGTRHPPRNQAAPPEPGTPPCGQTHACKHITLPQTSFAGGNNSFPSQSQRFGAPPGDPGCTTDELAI